MTQPSDRPRRPRPASSPTGPGADDVLRLLRGFSGVQDDPVGSTLRGLASRFGLAEDGPAPAPAGASSAGPVGDVARSALLARVAQLAADADPDALDHLVACYERLVRA